MLKFWMKDASPDPVMDIDNFGPEGALGEYMLYTAIWDLFQK